MSDSLRPDVLQVNIGYVVVTSFLSLLLCACSMKPLASPIESTPAASPGCAQAADGPENILLCAHEGNADALVRVVLGYLWGREGFVRDPALAYEWMWQATYMDCNVQTVALLQGIVSHVIFPIAHTHTRTVLEFAGESRFVRQLREDGIFDAAKCLASLPPLGADEEKESVELQSFWKFLQQAQDQSTALLRRLVTDKATAKELRWFRSGQATGVLPPWVLTLLSGNDEQPPEIALMRLIAVQGKDNYALRASGEAILRQHLLLDRQAVLDLLRRAHQGDLVAIRQTALNYAQGAAGFPTSTELRDAWQRRGAYAGDPLCQLAIAFYALDTPRVFDASSWAWASLAKERGDARVQTMADWILLRIEASASRDVLANAHELLLEYRKKAACTD